jgi:DNA-binding CsgD family transcriptional regulator
MPTAEAAIAERPVIPCTEAVGSAVAISPDTTAPAFGLTRRERQVLHLLVEGQTDPQIADRLCISPRTASWHVGRILAKLGAPSRTRAAIAAVRLGLA